MYTYRIDKTTKGKQVTYFIRYNVIKTENKNCTFYELDKCGLHSFWLCGLMVFEFSYNSFEYFTYQFVKMTSL